MQARPNYKSAGGLAVNTYHNRELIGKAAADMVCARLAALLKQQDSVNMIFAAAPSQNEFLAALTRNTAIEWGRVNAFHMDEYIGFPQNDPHTFSSFLKEKIFDRLPFRSIKYLDGNAARPDDECKRYAALVLQYPPDIICMGIGENAHIAFNDPHAADFNDPELVKVVSLDAACRLQQVHDGCFNEISEVPTHAITLTVPALMAGKYIYCMVPGEKKASAVYHTLHSAVSEKYPSTILRRHAHAVLFLDQQSSSLL